VSRWDRIDSCAVISSSEAYRESVFEKTLKQLINLL